jgi:hypothetical protein
MTNTAGRRRRSTNRAHQGIPAGRRAQPDVDGRREGRQSQPGEAIADHPGVAWSCGRFKHFDAREIEMRPPVPVSVAARAGICAVARSLIPVGALALAALLAACGAAAADTVRVGVNPVSAALPLYVGIGKGFFKDLGVDIETTKLVGGPANVAALISDQIDAAANMVTIEGINADIKKPGCAMYIAINSQNAKYVMEQFIARTGVDVKVLADFKGKQLLVAPGPANVTMARAVLLANGLREGDYTLDQLD